MDRFSDGPGEGGDEAWVENPGTERVNRAPSIAVSCLMEDSSITGMINPYRLSPWLLSTFPMSLLLVNLTPPLNFK